MHLFPNIFSAVLLYLLSDTLNQNYNPPRSLNQQAVPPLLSGHAQQLTSLLRCWRAPKSFFKIVKRQKNKQTKGTSGWYVTDHQSVHEKRCSDSGFILEKGATWPEDSRALSFTPLDLLLLHFMNTRCPHQKPATRRPEWNRTYCDWATITRLVWHLPVTSSYQLQRHDFAGPRHCATFQNQGRHRAPACTDWCFQSNLEPQNIIPTSQSISGGLTHPPKAKPSLCRLRVPSFHQQATFFNI